jgi:hypothetical protein
MKAGDLVNFHTSAWVFESANRRYANPGIILDVMHANKARFVAEVYWQDGRVTREHEGYLHLVIEQPIYAEANEDE